MKNFAIIGEKLSHTLSPNIHNQFFQDMNIEASYTIKEFSKQEFDHIGDYLHTIDGANVTVPYKEKVIPYLNTISKRAESVGAVNTIFNNNGVLEGYNTDTYGFEELLAFSNIDVKDKKCVVLGSGGASKAVVYSLNKLGASKVYVASRNPQEGQISYESISANDYYLCVNTTPVGMSPKVGESPLTIDMVDSFDVVVDLIYNPGMTMLLEQASHLGKKIVNGLYMLVAQAVASQSIWNKYEIDKKEINNIYNVLQTYWYGRNKNNLYLTGMMGCGKSTVGKMLAEMAGKKFIDLDKYIVEKTNKTIPQLFENGEAYFRNIESKALVDIVLQNDLIVSCGGGIILDEKNVEYMRASGLICYISRNIENIIATCECQGRPLLKDGTEKIRQIAKARDNLYNSTNNICIENNNSIEVCANNIAKKVGLL